MPRYEKNASSNASATRRVAAGIESRSITSKCGRRQAVTVTVPAAVGSRANTQLVQS